MFYIPDAGALAAFFDSLEISRVTAVVSRATSAAGRGEGRGDVAAFITS